MATVNASTWMSGIDDSVSIHQLSIPGSHESCSMFGAVSKCQNLGLIWQLARDDF